MDTASATTAAKNATNTRPVPPVAAHAASREAQHGVWDWLFASGPPSANSSGASSEPAHARAPLLSAAVPQQRTLRIDLAPAPDNKRLGLRLRTIRQGHEVVTVIVKVHPNSQAAAAGLCTGMRIVNVNGQAVSDKRSAIDIINLSSSLHLEVEDDWARHVACAPTRPNHTHAHAGDATPVDGSGSRTPASRSLSLSSLLEDFVICSHPPSHDDGGSVKSFGCDSISSYVMCDDYLHDRPGPGPPPPRRTAGASSPGAPGAPGAPATSVGKLSQLGDSPCAL